MELLTKLSAATCLAAAAFSADVFAEPCSVPDGSIVLREGLSAEIVYDASVDADAASPCFGEMPIGLPSQLAIDPQTGELYFGNVLFDGDDFIIIVNPETAEARNFPFFGNGLAFNKDGSKLYFGLSNLMLGVWNRDLDEFRKFTILPGVEAVQVVDDGTEKGRLLVANSDYGKNILGVDAVWEVNQGDGYYESVMQFNTGSEAVGVNFAALDAMAVDGAGNIHTLTGQGKVLIQSPDGSYREGNTAPVTKSGLMQGGMGASPDGSVYLNDTGAGELFATLESGKQVMVAYGDLVEAASAVDGGVTSDGESIYFVNDKGRVVRIYSTDGGSILSKLDADLGMSTLNGVITDDDGNPLQGVSVSLRDPGVETVTTNAAGEFSFNVPAGLYHVKATLPNFGDFNAQVTAVAAQSADMQIAMNPFLPGYLAPGLVADIVATKSADSIEGSSDVTFDQEGHVYSLNHSNGTITKTMLDSETRDVMSTFVAARAGGISNAWFIAIGNDLNMYTSSSNSGLLRLPPADPEQTLELSVDPDDERIVRDQNGVDRMVSYVTDIDGGTVLSDGRVMFTSGSGGSIIDGFPEGTVNTLISYDPASGNQALFSRGIPAGGGDTVFNNPDVLKSDSEDNLYVTNRGGNTVRVDTTGTAELIWPGDASGTDYPEGLSSYTAFASDDRGGMFFKGVDTEGVPVLRMLDPNDNRNLLVVARELSPSSGFGGFEFDADGQSVVLSEWDFVLRISTQDDRTIAENIINPPAGAQATVISGASIMAAEHSQAKYIQPKSQQAPSYRVVPDESWNKLPELWAFSEGSDGDNDDETEQPADAQNSSSGGSMAWLLVLLMAASGLRLRRSLK